MLKTFFIFNREISIYGIMALIGAFVIGILACRHSRKNKMDENDTIVFLLVSSIGVLLGAHFLYGLTNIETAIKIIKNISVINSFEKFVQASTIIFGGAVFYGGLLGGIFAGYLYLKKTHKNLEFYSCMIAPLIPLFHFFGRIGCFLGGCCYGIECKIGFVYQHSPDPLANGVTRFPVQLVEAAFNLLLFFILSSLQKNIRYKKYLLYIYLLSYSVFRFIVEFFRGDYIRGIYFGFSTSQIISVAILVCTSLMLFKSLHSSSAKTDSADI